MWYQDIRFCPELSVELCLLRSALSFGDFGGDFLLRRRGRLIR
jgi:hypothetical protein